MTRASKRLVPRRSDSGIRVAGRWLGSDGALPVERSAFVGRAADLDALVAELVRGARLCTIAGPGGIGKTRLLIELGRRYAPDLVRLCDLSQARSAADVESEVAACLAMTHAQSDDLLRALQRRGELVLLLDKFEQVADRAHSTIGRWLSECPELRILVASREVLRIEGEVRYELGPLAAEDALILFAERIDPRARPDDPESRALCRDIVQRLEGIPLAIELAAAHVSVLGLRALRDRLARSLLWMRNRRRDAPERHASIHAALGCTLDALSEPERRALVGACAFRGGFTLEAAEAVLAEGGDAVGLVQSLRDKSLLFVEDASAPVRFGMYEVVREHVRGALEGPGERELFALAHARYFSEAARDRGASLVQERHNLLAAHGTLLEADAAQAARLAIDLEHAVSTSAYLSALESSATALRGEPVLLATVLSALAQAIIRSGRSCDDAERSLIEALELSRAHGARRVEAEVLSLLCYVWKLRGNLEQADCAAEGALALVRGNARDEALCRKRLGLAALVHRRRDQLEEAHAQLSESLRLLQRLGDKRAEAVLMGNLARVEHDLGHLDRAGPLYDEALHLLRAEGDIRHLAMALYNLGCWHLEHDRLEDAERALLEALERASAIGDRFENAVLLGLCSLRLMQRDRNAAIALARSAASASSEDRLEALTSAMLAWAEMAEGNLEAAELAFERAKAKARAVADDSVAAAVHLIAGLVDLERARLAGSTPLPERARRRATAATARFSEARIYARILAASEETGRLQAPGKSDALHAEARGMWFSPRAAARVDLSRRPALRRVFRVLLAERLEAPAHPLSVTELAQRAWWGERILPRAAAARVYTSIRSLRRMGLADVLITRKGGYLLHPAVSVEIAEPPETEQVSERC